MIVVFVNIAAWGLVVATVVLLIIAALRIPQAFRGKDAEHKVD